MGEFVKTSLCTSWEISYLKVFSLNASRNVTANYIHFSFNFTRTTLFSQSFVCSRSGRRLGLRSFFLCPNILLHSDVSPNGIKSKTSCKIVFRSCRKTRCYPYIGPRVRCWYVITGTVASVMLRQNFLYCECLVDDSANLFRGKNHLRMWSGSPEF